ncbi:hypothetical protein ACPWT1_16710 [Ramlibacter sp. MMS24-I3-19]|uniref:hypothetical protein n=1 Tax=Ramlibacter sp. MMS24-I3-19 TaxID=3416606 RepID=UPI003D004327
MNRLDAELHRLYLPAVGDGAPTALVAPGGRVRALVLELVRPASWSDLAAVWQGVQADLDLPAPAIAVSGRDGWQLWFSLIEPIAPDTAFAFLQALRTRYLAGVPPERIRMHPSPAPSATVRVRHLEAAPPVEVAPERWSAFVSADLAPLFADEPWLDHPPGVDAQADLLARLASIGPEHFLRASALLRPVGSAAATAEGRTTPAVPKPADEASEPEAFLLAVMRDASVDLRLRIEAAKALLRSDAKAG